MLNLVLFGPPGSGKGTQAVILAQEYQLKHLSTGDLLRGEMAAKTPLGIAARQFIDAGELVPDEVVIGMIRNALAANMASVSGFIFDGFPRTVAQAEALDALLNEYNSSISKMLELKVSDDEIVRRLVERGKTSGRSDDNPETIKRRLGTYHNTTALVANYYAAQGIASGVMGEGEISAITQALCNEINVLA